MKGRYRTTFADGSTEESEAENPDEAKRAAKNKRYGEIDPARSLQAADRERHPRIKVAKVEEITDGKGKGKGAAKDKPAPKPEESGENES